MTASVLTPVAPVAPLSAPVPAAASRLRSVRPDESPVPPVSPESRRASARPGVYRLPEKVLAGLRLGEAETPLVGYLLLVPAGTAPMVAASTAVTPTVVTPTAVDASTSASSSDSAPAWPLAPTAAPEPSHSTHGLLVDRELRTAHLDGRQLELTYLEFELLSHLAAHPHRVHTRDRLVEAVWGYYGHVGDGRTVDVHVARLRRKLGPDYRARIVTVRRVGYKYVPTAHGTPR